MLLYDEWKGELAILKVLYEHLCIAVQQINQYETNQERVHKIKLQVMYDKINLDYIK